MSSKRATPVKLFIGILKVKDVHLRERLEERLISAFGPSDHRMILVPSNGSIHRVFLTFDRLIETESLSKIKELCQFVEAEFSAKLLVGFMDNRRVVVGENEEVISFKDGGMHFSSERHPDDLSDSLREFFPSARNTYRAQLRTMCLLRK